MSPRKFRYFSILSIVFLVSVSFAAAGNMTKSVSAPPEDILSGTLRMPAAGEIGIRSHSAMIPVKLEAVDAGVNWEKSFPVDSEEEVSLMLLAPNSSDWMISIREAGSATRRIEDFSLQDRVVHEQSFLGEADSAVPGEMWKVAHPAVGRWNIRISSKRARLSGGPVQGYLLVSSKSPYRIFSSLATYHLVPGEQVGLVTRLYDSRTETHSGAPAAIENAISSADLRVELPDGSTRNLRMADDGLHGDGAANDGVFGALFVAEETGNYTAQVEVHGRTPEGRNFIRTSEHVFPIVDGDISLDQRAFATIGEKSMEVRLGVVAPRQRDMLATAEIWGLGEDSRMHPVVWTSAITRPDEVGELLLKVDNRWLERAGVTEPLELRNISLRDLDTFVPVSEISSLPLELSGTLPSPSKSLPAISEEMLMGSRPLEQRHAKATGRLLLVHGYCSGGVWPTSHFSNYAVFQDYDQNRTHDQFARLIRDFGANYPSFGVVAHSQGGCAALHLYTYYWSGLDYSSGSRLIQSVGTPYQGTSLAGNLALLGEIFGVGCGYNWNLTYDGAAIWLSGIPSWARYRVYYATTSFEDKWWRYDYCNMASDLVLDDPDDGTTERWAGQLSGAHNMGHKEGWCHTASMRDPQQTTDYSRNYYMNIYANR